MHIYNPDQYSLVLLWHLTYFFIELSTKEDDLRVGKPVTCKIKVTNKSNKDLTVNLTGVVSSIKYTGFVWSLVKKEKFENVKIGGGKGTL